ncbi:OmpA family protein [Kordia zhangzhouensis]|uniref:OmpA family protein n=1 Tax=Kordia zhangzhouensis TaxID=1620405 RepID=UPI00069B5026|nr:OmpA family protein [Kordia zhangzhouensis]
MKRLLLIFLGSIHFCLAQEVEFDIFFDLGKYTLSSKHEKKIDAQLANLDTTTTYNFVIKGYTDFVDTETFNLKLSQDRADAVTTYLQKQYESIINSIEKEAKGELPNETSQKNEQIGIQQHRKVSITISKNDHKPKITERKENIYVVPTNELKVGSSYSLGKINFKTGRVTLIKSSKKELEKLVRFLRKNRNIHIEVQGHVCCGGDDDSDALNSDTGTYTLSVDRARFIYNYLINRGIDKDRLSYKGYAFKTPLHFPEKGNRDRSANRRVEIKITKN